MTKSTGSPLLSVRDLTVSFPIRSGFRRLSGSVRAVDDVSFDIARGETLGIVGESGCGKTTLSRAVLRLVTPTAGTVLYAGRDLASCSRSELRSVRRDIQIVFQDPYDSLNPKLSVRQIISDPLQIHNLYKGSRDSRVNELLQMVGLPTELGNVSPTALSGGQRQRVAIARTLACSPNLVILDEPVSALDVSIQAQVLNLLKRLRRELSLSYIFVAHDLAVVRRISDRIAVMYLGRIVELSDAGVIYSSPSHPYTKALVSSAPLPDPKLERARQRIVVSGELPSPIDPPRGCSFHTRCWLFDRLGKPSRCVEEPPRLRQVRTGGYASCHFAEDTNR